MTPALSTRRVVRVVAAATVSIVLAIVPVFLVGALSVPMRRELGFDEVGLGLAVAVFFGVSTVTSIGGGWYAQRFGALSAVTFGAVGSMACLLGISLLATRFTHVLALLCVGGCANAVSQPGANLVLAQVVPERWQGLSFGLKQASVPVATLFAGLAVPLVALQVGWRWAFAGPAVLAVVLALVWPPATVPTGAPVGPRRNSLGFRRRYGLLALLAAAAAFGSAAANAMAAFFVAASVARGFSVGASGVWLGAGSLCGAVGRVLWGWLADRRGGDHLQGVAVLMIAGAAAVFSLGHLTGRTGLAVATVVAFGAGWGWTGLLNSAVVRRNSRAPAVAIGVVTSGVFLGGAVGPLVYGFVARNHGYTRAWTVAAVALLVSGVLVEIAHQRSRVDDREESAFAGSSHDRGAAA